MIKLPTIRVTNPVARIALRAALYGGVFLFSFVVFVYVFFPYNRWKGDIEDILSARLGRNVRIEDVDGWRLVGIKLNGVTITSKDEEKSGRTSNAGAAKKPPVPDSKAGGGKTNAPEKKEEKGEEDGDDREAGRKEEKGITVDSIAVRPGLLSFLFGSSAVIFDADIFDGGIDGKAVFGKESSIDIDIDDVKVRNIKFLENLLGLPFLGEVNGSINLEYPKNRISDMTGDVKIEVSDLQIGEKGSKLDLGKAGGGIIKGAIKFEPVEVGDLELKISGEDGSLKIVELQASSKHLELMGGGEISVLTPALMSRLNLYVKFKFRDEYVQKSAMTKSVFATLDRLTKFRQAKRTDGFWGFALRGTLAGDIKPIPARVGPGGM